MHENSDKAQILIASHAMAITAEQESETVEDVSTTGNWYCGEKHDASHSQYHKRRKGHARAHFV